jgi:predicted flap endonuclease-1-like 5' DNA nuclease
MSWSLSVLSQIDGTIFSVVLCILAGIALRYALYYGREAFSEQPPAPNREPVATLSDGEQDFGQRTRLLHDALEREQAAQVRLRRDVERLRDEFYNLQQENQDLHKQLDEYEKQEKIAENQLETLGLTLDEQRRLVESERLHSSDLLNQLKASNQTLEQLRQQDATMAALAEEMRRMTQERDELATTLAAAQNDLHSERQRNQEYNVQFERVESELERRMADAHFMEELRTQNNALQDLLQDSKEQYRSLQDNRDELRSKFEMAAQAIEELRSETGRWRQRAEQLHGELDQSQGRLGEFVQRERLAEQARLDLEEQLRSAAAQIQDLHLQQRQWIQEGQDQLESMDRERQAELRVVRQQLLATLEDKQQELDELRSELARRMDELQRLLVEMDRLQHVDATIVEKERQLSGVTQERDSLKRISDDAAERIEHLEAHIREADGRLRYVATEKDELVLGLQREKESRLVLQNTTNSLQDRVRLLETESIELSAARTRLQTTEHDLQAVRNELGLISAERDELKIALTRSERRLETLEGELLRSQGDLSRRESAARQLRIEKEEALTHLERERNERGLLERKLRLHAQTIEKLTADSRSLESLLERQKALQTSLVAHTQRLNAVSDDKYQGEQHAESDGADVVNFEPDRMRNREERTEMVRDPHRGWIYSNPPRHIDDLKKIVGIGEIIEAQLHELGVYTFEQIMQWDPLAIQSISQELAFKDRIEREQWVKQASQLHRERERRAA